MTRDSDRPELTPGYYLVNNRGAYDQHYVRVKQAEFQRVVAEGRARVERTQLKTMHFADVERGFVARVDADNRVVIERKGAEHQENRRGRDRYASYAL